MYPNIPKYIGNMSKVNPLEVFVCSSTLRKNTYKFSENHISILAPTQVTLLLSVTVFNLDLLKFEVFMPVWLKVKRCL